MYVWDWIGSSCQKARWLCGLGWVEDIGQQSTEKDFGTPKVKIRSNKWAKRTAETS